MWYVMKEKVLMRTKILILKSTIRTLLPEFPRVFHATHGLNWQILNI